MASKVTTDQSSRWPRRALAGDVLALLAGSVIAMAFAPLPVLSGGSLTAGGAWFAAIYVVFTTVTLLARRRGAGHLPATVVDSCFGALRSASTGVLLAIATAAVAGAQRITPAAVWLWLITTLLMFGERTVIGLLTRRARLRGDLATPTLVVGAGIVGGHVARRLLERPEYGLHPVGFLDADPMPEGADTGGVPVLGGPEDLAEVCERTGARQVILAFAAERDRRLVEVVNQCRTLGIGVSVVPRLYESINERARLDHIGGLPLLALAPVNPKGWQFAVKHAFDRVFAMVTVLLLSPLLAAIALSVRLSSPGPVIFRQRRVGRDERAFDLLKFRTMRIEADADRQFIPRAGSAPGGVEGVDRRTSIGRWLRSTSLDELPQLLNVLRGEMSMIGPRPERPEFVERFAGEIPNYDSRHRVKSGITGWAQVNGLRGQTSIADRIEWDNHYIENWSLSLDLRTLALTFAEVLRFREDRQPLPSTFSEPDLVSVTESAAAAGARSAGTSAVANASATAPHPLRLVSEVPDLVSSVWFCGYCGASPSIQAPAPHARVCSACGHGLLLEARADGAPADQEAFLVVDSRLTVQAVSALAEQALGLCEQDTTDRPIAQLLVGADSENSSDINLAEMLVRAASEPGYAQRSFVRPRDTFGVRLPIRVTSCGPPQAALIVFESGPPIPPRLRLADQSSAEVSGQAEAGAAPG
jgi:exopolysaccharide biosynthesis polyprenyl glycosylphosphotransferase